MYGPYNHGWMFDGGIGMFLGGLWMMLIWVVPVLLVAALLRYLFTRPRHHAGQERAQERPSALDLVKEAYARGEISREEFLQKRDDILEK